MGWRGTLVLIGLVILVGAYLRLTDPPPKPAERAGAPLAQPPNADSVQMLRKLLVFAPLDVISVQLQRDGQTRRVQRDNGSWQGTDTPSTVNDFLHTLSQLPVLTDISATATELADYGLAAPLGVIVLQLRDQSPPLVLQIGERNPATTGVYVRLGEDGPVVLAGALIEWEFDKLFRQLTGAG